MGQWILDWMCAGGYRPPGPIPSGLKDGQGRRIVDNATMGPLTKDFVYEKDAKAPYNFAGRTQGRGVSGGWKPQANALGGSGTVTKPTLFLAGEAGPEDYAFVPHLKGGMGGGMTVNGPLVHIEQATIREEADARRLADEFATQLERRMANSSPGGRMP
jgi:hypothetical protein